MQILNTLLTQRMPRWLGSFSPLIRHVQNRISIPSKRRKIGNTVAITYTGTIGFSFVLYSPLPLTPLQRQQKIL
jgi:hypothetical protein